MRVARRTVLAFLAAASLVGCALFSDLGGFSGGDPDGGGAPGPDGGGDVSASDATTSGDGSTAPIDAGPDASPYALAVLEDKPIAYWPMDDAPGCVVVAEVIGNKKADFSGTLGCGAAGVSGTAIEKKDQNQVLEVGDFFDFAGFSPYTIEVWAKPTFGTQFPQYPTMISKRRPNTPYGWSAYFHQVNAQDPPGFQMEHVSPNNGNRTVFTSTPDAAAKFHHVVVTYDPNVATGPPLRMYYDGVRTDGYDDDIPANDTTEPVWIGVGYVGLLDEVALYDHALTVERVQAHYQLGKK